MVESDSYRRKDCYVEQGRLGLYGKGGRYSVPAPIAKESYAYKYIQEDWTQIFLERELMLSNTCSMVENEHGEPWSSVMDMDSIAVDDDKYNECCYREVSPLEYYMDLFPPDTIEDYRTKLDAWNDALDDVIRCDVHGEYVPRVYIPTPVVSCNYVRQGYEVTDKRGWYQRNMPMFSDYKVLDQTTNNRFALCSLCTYLGRQKTAKRAYDIRGYCIDLDWVTLRNLENLFALIDRGIIPRPTYVINSGHGVHIVYVFAKAIPIRRQHIPFLQEVKKRLTDVVWTNDTSSYEQYGESKQYQGIYQCFRMPGSWAKFDATANKRKTRFIIRAYKVGRRVDLSDLTAFLDNYMVKYHMGHKWGKKLDLRPENDLSSVLYNHYTLDEARVLFPDWYERRVVQGEAKGHWTCTKGLYDWWYDILQRPGTVICGHRYASLCCLFIYAIKCAIPLEDAYADAMNLVEYFDELTIEESNHFTPYDVECAAKYYDAKYYTVSYNGRHGIKSMSGIENLDDFKTVKRNGHKQKAHLAMARAYRADASYEHVGRPSHREAVQKWKEQNPEGRKADCIRETGLSKPTVYRWWN